MNEVLKIEVQAQVAQAQAALRQLQTSLKGTEQAAAGVTKQMPKFGQSTSQATFALQNLGRVASDAPFGLIGIANNIEPLIQSFVQLRAGSTSAGGALKALGGSLLGGGGLILGVSLLTSALQFGALGFDRWKTKQKEAKEKADEAADSITKQYTEVLLLTKAYENSAGSLDERKKIVSQLNKVSSEYFGNLNAEKTTVDQLKVAYDKYIDNLLRSFAVKQLEADLDPLIKRLANAQLTIKKLGEDIKKLGLQNVDLRNLTENERIALSTSGVTKFNAAKREEAIVREEINKLIEAALFLTTQDIKTTTQKTNAVKEQVSVYKSIQDIILFVNQEERKKVENQILLNQLLEQENKLRKTGEKPPELTAQQQLAIVGSDASRGETGLNGLPQKIEQAKQLNETLQLSDQLINSIAGEFADLFTNLSKDGVKAFEDIAKSIAQTTQRILIQYAVTQALKALLNSIAPGSGSISDLTGVQGGGTGNLDIRNLRILG
jgi:hypothetical protein